MKRGGGFFSDPRTGGRSMTRLCAFLLTLAACGVASAVSYYLATRTPEAAVIAASTGVVGALVAGGAVALLNRTRPSDAAPPSSDSSSSGGAVP